MTAHSATYNAYSFNVLGCAGFQWIIMTEQTKH